MRKVGCSRGGRGEGVKMLFLLLGMQLTLSGARYMLKADGLMVEEMVLHESGNRDLRNMEEGSYTICTAFEAPAGEQGKSPARSRPPVVYRFSAAGKEHDVELQVSGNSITGHSLTVTAGKEVVCGGKLKVGGERSERRAKRAQKRSSLVLPLVLFGGAKKAQRKLLRERKIRTAVPLFCAREHKRRSSLVLALFCARFAR
jgi:hypothetical protein